jgi:hypothetical protein
MHKDFLDTLKGQLTTLIETPLETITRTKELGTEIDFSSLSSHIQYAQRIAKRALQIDYSLLNNEKVTQFASVLSPVLTTLNQISKFEVNDLNDKSDPIQRRDKMIETCKNNINTFSEIILPYLSLIIDDVKVELNSQKLEAEKIIASILDKSNIAKSLLEAQSKVVSNTGIIVHSNIFKEQSETYRKNANVWLGFAIAILFGIFLFGFNLLNRPPMPENQISIIYFSVARIIILTSLFYALNICNKNVKSFRHNSILNKHRHNALMSFQTFTTSSDDEMTKNSILLEATRTIYGIQNTGFGDSDNESENPIKVIEILKNITKTSSS